MNTEYTKTFLPILLVVAIVIVGAMIYNRSENVPTDSNQSTKLSEADARVIAESSCIKGGEALVSGGTYNEDSKTWWFDANLNATQEGCNPACVVSEETKSAEVNWRCTGAIPPDTNPVIINCLPEQRNVDACTADYTPICATVEIQCIKAPCNPIQETFSNSCNACKNSLVKSYITGECQGV